MASCVEALDGFLNANPVAAGTPEAAAAFAAAEAIDSARDARLSGAAMQGEAAMVGRFIELISSLRALVPERREESPLDEIRARRDAKLLRGADAPDRVGSTG